MEEWDKDYPWTDEDEDEDEEEEDEFCDRECYVFNYRLKIQLDDNYCWHCIKYLTLRCEYIEDFIEEIEEFTD